MEDEQELKKKKLAEWARFTERDYTPLGKLRDEYKVWYDPDGNCLYYHLPDFIQSLDACFRWLVPEAVRRYGDTVVAGILAQWAEGVAYSRHKDREALALCLAISKLIEQDVDNAQIR